MKSFRILLIILFIAFLVRATFIGTYFTGDAIDTVGPARNYVEIGRAAVYATHDSGHVLYGYIDDGLFFNFTHPPMRIILYSLWASLFGFSNAAMILLPIIFGLLTVLLTYMIGKELYSEKVGLIAAFFTTIIRYSFYASIIGFGDNFLMFTMAASVYFFLKYIKTTRKIFIPAFSIFIFLGFLTKFSSVSILPICFFISYIYRKEIRIKKTTLIFLLPVVLSIILVFFSYPLVEYFTGVSNNEYNFFDSYIATSLTTSSNSQNLLQGKIFYFLSFVWQFTPFFTALIFLALIKLKRNKSYWVLISWFAVTFLIGFATTGQDFQRLMTIAIAPAILLVAKYVSDPKFSKEYLKFIVISGITVFFLAQATGLNDLSPTYTLWLTGAFFLLALIFMILPKNRQILIGASIGLSLFFLIGATFLVNINSSVVQQITNEVKERDYPYNELWTTRDVSMYLAPVGEPSFLQSPQLNKEFLASQNVTYFAFYSIYEENNIIEVSKLCEDLPFFAKVNGKKVGLVCKIKSNI